MAESPADATAGLPVALLATSNTRVRVRPLDPPGPDAFVGPHRDASHDGHGGHGAEPITLLPPRRGVHDRVVVQVATRRSLRLAVVAQDRRGRASPRPARRAAPGPPPPPARRDGTTSAEVASVDSAVQIGEPRGVRPYRPGDLRRFVHWPATAHSGEMMVREMEGPTAEPVSLEIHLPGDADAAEAMAERAMATVVALVDRGDVGAPGTTESDGPRLGTVGDRRSAGRRLARAVAEPDRAGAVGRVPDDAPDRPHAHERLRRGQARQPARASRALDHAARRRAPAR